MRRTACYSSRVTRSCSLLRTGTLSRYPSGPGASSTCSVSERLRIANVLVKNSSFVIHHSSLNKVRHSSFIVNNLFNYFFEGALCPSPRSLPDTQNPRPSKLLGCLRLPNFWVNLSSSFHQRVEVTDEFSCDHYECDFFGFL